jgi:hypothetical protein
MYNFTLNNHLKYTIDNEQFAHRTTPYQKYAVTVGKIDKDHYKSSTWLKEQYRTAETILNEFGRDLVVMFSGGTDSEIVLRAFKHVGLVPRAVFVKFKNDYNIGDLRMAEKIARDMNMKIEVMEFDVKEFYNSGQAYEFAGQIQCRQMAYLTVYHHILKLQAPSVMGGEMLFKRHVDRSGSRWYYCIRENEDGSAMRFSLKYKIPLVNEWFSYTPEMMGYYLEHPKIKWLITERYNYKMGSVSSKNTILHQYMPELLEKRKTHGYERLLGFNGETYSALHESHVKRLESSLDGIFIDDLKTQLY